MHGLIAQDALQGAEHGGVLGPLPHGGEQGHGDGLSHTERLQHIFSEQQQRRPLWRREPGDVYLHLTLAAKGAPDAQAQLGVVQLIIDDALAGVDERPGHARGDEVVDHPRRHRRRAVLSLGAVSPLGEHTSGGAHFFLLSLLSSSWCARHAASTSAASGGQITWVPMLGSGAAITQPP